MSKKKKIIIAIICVIISLILFFPVPVRYKDGGSVCYRAVLYSVTKYHQLPDAESDAEYIGGTGISILGIPVYENKYPVH